MLRAAKAALGKCKSWMPPDVYGDFKSTLAWNMEFVEEVAAQYPRGAAMLPEIPGCTGKYGHVDTGRCTGCAKQSGSLKKCSSCQVAAYCRDCQVRHWKQGGHKQECAQLAAGSSGGASGSRS